MISGMKRSHVAARMATEAELGKQSGVRLRLTVAAESVTQNHDQAGHGDPRGEYADSAPDETRRTRSTFGSSAPTRCFRFGCRVGVAGGRLCRMRPRKTAAGASIESRAQGRTRKRTQRTGGRQRTSAVWPGGRDVFPVAEIIPVAKGATALSLPPVEKDLDVAVRKDDRQSRPPSSRAEKGREARQITQNP